MALRDNGSRQSRRSRTGPQATGDPAWWKFLAVGLVIVALLAGGGWLYWQSKKNYVPTDDNTLCATDRPPTELVTVLFDTSDRLTEAQLLRIRSELTRVRNGLDTLGLITVYAVDPSTRVLSPAIQICNPGDGSKLNELYQNPKFARDAWEAFSKALDERIQSIMDGAATDRSAIMEAIQSTALRTFGAPEFDAVRKRRLYIVSDLMQNQPGKLNMYTGIPEFARWKQSPYYSEVRADLKGIDVHLLYIVRPKAPQRWPQHVDFWQGYFRDQGAQVQELIAVGGAE